MIPDPTNATPATRAYYAFPEDIRAKAEKLDGSPRPMSHLEILLAIGTAIADEQEVAKRGEG